MCFRRKNIRAILPEKKLSNEKMNAYFTDYLSHVISFLFGHLGDNKIELTSDFKTTLDDIKAKMIAHANRHTVEYNENVVEVYLKCIDLVELQFQTMLIVLNEKNQLVIDKQLRKLKSMRALLNINSPSGSLEAL